jgi:hypothetical protein
LEKFHNFLVPDRKFGGSMGSSYIILNFFLPSVLLMVTVHLFAEVVVPKILFQLCSGPMTPTQHLETQQALVKQFAEILEFVLKFDEYKVSASELCHMTAK